MAGYILLGSLMLGFFAMVFGFTYPEVIVRPVWRAVNMLWALLKRGASLSASAGKRATAKLSNKILAPQKKCPKGLSRVFKNV